MQPRLFRLHTTAEPVRYSSFGDYSCLRGLDSSCRRGAIVEETGPDYCRRCLATMLIESQFSKWRAVGMFNSGSPAGEPFIFHHVFYRQRSYHGNW